MDDVVVLGCGLSPFRSSRFDGSIRDWVAEAVLAALADSGLEHEQIDQSLMAYESDHLAGQIGQGVIWHDTVGLTPRPTARIEGCGATGGLALRSAFAAIASSPRLCSRATALSAVAWWRGVSFRIIFLPHPLPSPPLPNFGLKHSRKKKRHRPTKSGRRWRS